MPRAAPGILSFNRGELSPRVAGRVDQQAYGAGCHRLENFIPDIAGPAIKRGGTVYVSAIKDHLNLTWLVRFEFSATVSFMLEFGNQYIRFFQNHAPVTVSGVAAYSGATAYAVGDLVVQAGVNYYCVATTTGNAPPNATYWYPLTGAIYEIPSPYGVAELVNEDGGFAISFVQSGDVIYLAHRKHLPRKLSHYATTRWTLTSYSPTGGPFKDVNVTATTLYASANTGAVALIASTAIFTADLVGSLIYVEQKTVSDVKQWEVGKAITTGDIRRSGGRNYKALNTKTTGSVTPTHTEGSVYDGDDGVQWEFLDAGYGWAQITVFTSPTQVTATVLSRIPDGAVLVGNASTKWALGAWNEVDGYPDAVTFYLDRITWARDSFVWMTVSGDYENMQARDNGRQTAESAVSLTLPSRRGNRTLWLETLEVGLVVGTGADEWLIGPASHNDAFGPTNVATNPIGAVGSRGIPVLRMFDSIVFTQRSGKRLRDLRYTPADGPLRTDLNALADHVTPGFVSVAYTAEPHSMIWGAGSDGSLCGLVYYPEQEVLGWARFPLDGFVECVQTIPAPDGGRDDLWLIIRRTINGVTARYVEYMKAPLADDGDQADAFYVDAGKTYSGAATATIAGLDHLEGQTVNVLVNGATHPQRTVAAGQITLQTAGTTVQVGLPYTATLATMDLEAGAANGTAQAKLKRVFKGYVRLLRTLGGRAGPSQTKLDTLSFRDASAPMGSPPPLFTGDKGVPWPGGTERQARVWFVHEDPTPCTVIAIFPQIDTQDG